MLDGYIRVSSETDRQNCDLQRDALPVPIAGTYSKIGLQARALIGPVWRLDAAIPVGVGPL